MERRSLDLQQDIPDPRHPDVDRRRREARGPACVRTLTYVNNISSLILTAPPLSSYIHIVGLSPRRVMSRPLSAHAYWVRIGC